VDHLAFVAAVVRVIVLVVATLCDGVDDAIAADVAVATREAAVGGVVVAVITLLSFGVEHAIATRVGQAGREALFLVGIAVVAQLIAVDDAVTAVGEGTARPARARSIVVVGQAVVALLVRLEVSDAVAAD
jgi:hypothetical protein